MNQKNICCKVVITIAVIAVILSQFARSEIGMDNKVWNQIVNREWSNIDSFPGMGFYFFQEDGGKYCLFMVYGSGLPIIYRSVSEVSIHGNQIEIAAPVAMDLKEMVPGIEKQSSGTFIIQFENDRLIFSDTEYTHMRLNDEDIIWDEIERFRTNKGEQSE